METVTISKSEYENLIERIDKEELKVNHETDLSLDVKEIIEQRLENLEFEKNETVDKFLNS